MRILAINQYYAPDHAATSQILTELCEDLVSLGDDVTVIASRGTYQGGARLPEREMINGVRVVRAWATNFGKSSITARLSDYGTFWASSIVSAAVDARPDVILAVTTPPMIAAAAALVAGARSVPLVTWTQDVYPEVAVEFGMMRRNGFASRALLKLQGLTHRASTRVVAISDGMADRLKDQGAPVDRLTVVHNWSDGRSIRPREESETAFRREHDLTGRFVVMYSGNLGIGHEFETFMDAARRLEHSAPSILFLFVGDGGRRKKAEGLARGLSNVRFLPYQPRDALGESLSAADGHLVCLREGLDGFIVPSKIYGAIACGRPVFYVGPEACEVTRLIREVDAGWSGRPGDAAGLAGAIERAATDQEWSRVRGLNARRAFDEKYDRPHAVRRWRQALGEALGR